MLITRTPYRISFVGGGTDIQIVDFDSGISSKPDTIFILAWNFKDEIIKECRSAGYNGEFIVPFPNKPKII